MGLFSGWRKPQPLKEDWAQEFEDLRRWTPDYVELEKKEWQPFFSCDETLPGLSNHFLLKNQEMVYEAYTQGPHIMVTENLGRYSRPLIFNNTLNYVNPPPFLPIKGKLYKVEPKLFLELDRMKQNGVQFVRQSVPVVIPYQKIFFKDRAQADQVLGTDLVNAKTRKVEGKVPVGRSYFKQKGVYRIYAWMYLAEEDYWRDLLNFSIHEPVATFRNSEGVIVKEFYDFYRDQTPPF